MKPIIKWTGSKRSQAKNIVSIFPKDINTYYEPFVGSGAVLAELLQQCESNNYTCKSFICSDINADLIGTWNLIKTSPDLVYSLYTEFYNEFAPLDIDCKKLYYKNKVNLFNNTKLKDDNYYALFFWIRRTCFNGLVRYNKKGEFNAPCHFTRNGITPEQLKPILYEWHNLLAKYDVQFICRSYSDIIPEQCNIDDVLYLDRIPLP